MVDQDSLDCSRGLGSAWEAADDAGNRDRTSSAASRQPLRLFAQRPQLALAGAEGSMMASSDLGTGGTGGGSGGGGGFAGPPRQDRTTLPTGQERTVSYQPEERYWTDYLRIALPVTGLLILLGLFWWWGTSIIGGGDDAPPPTQAAAVISEVNAPVASPSATAPPPALAPNVGAPPASPPPAQESAPPPNEAEPTPAEEAPPEEAAEDPPEADPAQSTSIPTLVVGSSATADGSVNVREEPSADSPIVAELNDGDVVTVTGEQVTNEGSDGDLREWYPVETAAGETGFVREDLLQPAE